MQFMKAKPAPHASKLSSHAMVLQRNDRFQAKSTIGVGTFGAVFLATDLSTGRDVAIKKVFQDPRYKNRELDLVQLLDHPNCLRYIHHYTTQEGPSREVFLHLVTSYVPTALHSFVESCPLPPPVMLKVFGFQIFAALAYLHHHGVCHRDMKPSNVLVDPATGYLQLCDFGSAKFLKPGEVSVSYIATRSYRAPELLLDCPSYTPAVDIWAAGCILAEMVLQGRVLFPGPNNGEVFLSIIQTIGAPKPTDFDNFEHKKPYQPVAVSPRTLASALPKWTPPGFVDVLCQAFVYAPEKRATAAALMRHPFFADLFCKDLKLPNKAPLPDYLARMSTPENMFRNFPNGPSTPKP
jgi:glycogen synthase kinase 3 beta